MSEWFYSYKGVRKGPVTAQFIKGYVEKGKLDNDSKLWQEGFKDWVDLGSTEFAIISNVPPPLDGNEIKNNLVWLIAFLPILGFILEWIVSVLKYEDSDVAYEAWMSGEFFYVTMILTILLCMFDARGLNNAGYNTKKFKGWVWLVPVYLYQRSKFTQTKGYFTVWFLSFGLVILFVVLAS